MSLSMNVHNIECAMPLLWRWTKQYYESKRLAANYVEIVMVQFVLIEDLCTPVSRRMSMKNAYTAIDEAEVW